MSHYQPSYNELNAYVDGELDAVTRAQVADAIASDAGLARKVARLSAVKAALPDAMPDLPDIDLRRASVFANVTTRWRQPLVASFVLFFVAAATLAGYFTWQSSTGPRHSWHELAKAQHQTWASKPLPAIDKKLVPASIEPSRIDFPDLTAARLTLRVVERVHLGTVGATRLGYTGTRGCHVSLFVLDAVQASANSMTAFSPEMRVAEWRASGRSYLLLSTGMDKERFDLLAEVLERFTLRPQPFDTPTEQQLAESRRNSRACAA